MDHTYIRMDETYIKVKGKDRYLYRAVDSTGQTIDFLLTAKRDAAGAKRFFRKALQSAGNPAPRVVNGDKNPAYPAAIQALQAERFLSRRVRLRQCKYLNNIVEQDHRTVKKRVWLAKGYGSFQSAWRRLQGIETMHMINKDEGDGWLRAMPSAKRTSLPACSVSPPKKTPQHCRFDDAPKSFPSSQKFATEPDKRTQCAAGRPFSRVFKISATRVTSAAGRNGGGNTCSPSPVVRNPTR